MEVISNAIVVREQIIFTLKIPFSSFAYVNNLPFIKHNWLQMMWLNPKNQLKPPKGKCKIRICETTNVLFC